jgi:hypothetical protein
MATEILATMQATGEIRTHFVDFSNDLPAGVSIASGTATHTPPSGGTVTCSVGVIASNIVPVTVPPLSVTGRHVVTVNATLSDNEIITARLIIPVQWDAVRATITHLIGELRSMIDAGSNDYTIGGVPYWTDKQIQNTLDLHREYVNFETIEGLQNNGTLITYTMFPTGKLWWEDTAIIQEAGGGTLSGTLYSMNLLDGLVTFNANQGGSARYITGYSYNLYAAAADIWRKKAGHYAGAYDFSTDNHSLKRSQLMAQARTMASQFNDLAFSVSGSGVNLDRNDQNGC